MGFATRGDKTRERRAFPGSKPYEKLQRTLRAEIDEAAWSSLYSTRDQDTFSTIHMARNMSITVEYDPTLMVVTAATSHPARSTGGFTETDLGLGRKRWTIERGLLPGHSIEVLWRQPDTSTAPPSSGAGAVSDG